MKSVAQQFVETQDALKAKGVTVETIAEALKDAVNEEHRLSILLSLAKKKNIKESVDITESARRVKRNNGSGIDESTTEDRVQRTMKLHKMSFREASIFCGQPDPGPKAKTPAAFTESLFKAWKKYAPWISDADANTLATRGIEP